MGDTITITHHYTGHSVNGYLHIDDTVTLSVGSDVVHRSTEGLTVGSGDTKTASFQYTLGQDDIGRLTITHYATTSYADKSYEAAGSIHITVRAPQPEFTATLSAAPTTIFAGDAVTATIRITNTGDRTTDFTIYDSSGSQRGTVNDVHAGASRNFTEQIFPAASGDIRYKVKGKLGSETVERQTNAVTITVSPASTTSSSTTVTTGSTTTAAVVTTATTSVANQVTTTMPAAQAAAEKKSGISNTLLLVIIVVCAVVVIAAIVTTGVVLMKRRP